jgi:hypothetical protein
MSETEQQLKARLEKEGMQKAAKIGDTADANVGMKQCISIIQDGASEFKQKTGREMTYSEMREMYG